MFQVFFNKKREFQYLLIALLIAGFFPVGVGIYQRLTGQIWHIREAAGLTRLVGLYHDAVAVRFYMFQTLAALLLYWSYFKTGGLLRMVLPVYGILCCVVLFGIYSKAAFVILFVWLLVWSLFRRHLVLLCLGLLFVLLANVYLGGIITEQTKQTFSKELRVAEGKMDSEYVLSGRLTTWRRTLASWSEGGIFKQFFGMGGTYPAHNDYLRILYSNGVLGLTAYLLLLTTIGFKCTRNVLRNTNALNLVGFMLFLTWLIDSIGVSPSMYPGYQWYVLGFIGLSLRGVEGLEPTYPKESRG
jgi:O-antigen ligase